MFLILGVIIGILLSSLVFLIEINQAFALSKKIKTKASTLIAPKGEIIEVTSIAAKLEETFKSTNLE